MKIFNHKYNPNYSKLTPLLASPNSGFFGGNSSAPNLLAITPLERARKSLAQNQAAQPPAKSQPPHQPEQTVSEPVRETNRKERPATKVTHPAKPTARRNGPAPKIKSRRVKRPPVITATVTGLLLSAVVLLAVTGLYGAYCYAQGTHGDASVKASTAIYALAVFAGCFWSAAVVRRQSKLPPIIIGAVYVIVSLVISAQIFTLADFKLLMICQKILITAVAGAAGYVLSLIPYLLGRATKRR